MSSLEERVQRLEDERAILWTLCTYGHAIDYGHENEYADCWMPAAVLYWPRREPLEGRDAIVDAFRAHTHAPEAFHKHIMVEPRIEVAGDRARCDSYYVRIDAVQEGPVVRGFGRYLDVLIRADDGRWRFIERRAEMESLLAHLLLADSVARARDDEAGGTAARDLGEDNAIRMATGHVHTALEQDR